MKIFEKENKIIVENAQHFNLEQTFNCGQCFRWEKVDDKYFVVAFSKRILVYFQNKNLIIENSDIEDFDKIWKNYFGLNINYEKINQNLMNMHPVLKKSYELCSGIRILKQDIWEVLCSFIISQNNNIPRIKKIICLLCENFGDKIENGFSFPSAEALSCENEQNLDVIKSGFRAKYIIDAAKKISTGEIDLKNIEKLSNDEARKSLIKICGVGPKIAECVLLYGLGRLDAFPMDVWMKKIMKILFFGQTSEFFGKYAGVAQQYLYHFFRTNPENLNKNFNL